MTDCTLHSCWAGDATGVPEKSGIATALVRSAIALATSTEERRRLRHEAGLLLIVRVPSPAWITPTAQFFARDFACITEVVEVRSSRRGSAVDVAKVCRALAASRGLALVTTDETLVPPALRAAADLTVAFGPPTARLVRRAVRLATGRPVRRLCDGDVAGLDFDDVVAAVRDGASTSTTVRRLQHARLKRSARPEVAHVPALHEIAGLGEAGDWGWRAVDDLVRIRTGDEGRRLESVLLYGPPGCGKTHLALSIAQTAGVPVVYTSVSHWFSRREGTLGDVIQAAEDVFREAMATQPSVLIIDELDALPDRAQLTTRGADWWTPIVTHALLLIDRLRRARPGVLLVGATNRPEALDPALVRPGRFDRKIRMPPPDEEGLRAILVQMLDGALDADDIARVAACGAGATGATARAWVDAARARADRDGRPLRLEDLVAEVLPQSSRSDMDRRIAALHEAGHAVVAVTLGKAVERISLVSVGGIAGSTEVSALGAHPTANDVDTTLAISLAGRAADEELGQGANAGAVADLERATLVALSARRALGLRDGLAHFGEPADLKAALAADRKLAADVEADLRRAYERAVAIVRDNRERIEAVAARLIERQVLAGGELRAILLGGVEAASPTRSPPSVR